MSLAAIAGDADRRTHYPRRFWPWGPLGINSPRIDGVHVLERGKSLGDPYGVAQVGQGFGYVECRVIPHVEPDEIPPGGATLYQYPAARIRDAFPRAEIVNMRHAKSLTPVPQPRNLRISANCIGAHCAALLQFDLGSL
jgi:hypothetical protein